MTRDESIELSVKLGKEYEQLKKLEDNIVDLDRRVAIPADTDKKHYSVFSYFVKPLAISFIVIGVLSIPAFVILSISAFLAQSGYDGYDNTPAIVGLFLVFIFALIHFIGGFYARKKAKQMNMIEEDRVAANLKIKKEQKATIEDLMGKLAEREKDLSKYNSLVPSSLRSKEGMNKIKILLMSNKAGTFEEAVELLNRH